MKLVVSFLSYALAAGLCFLLVSSARADCTSRSETVQFRAWKIICPAILLLGLLRPFEVHSRITEVLRTSAMTSGWYAERAAQQMDLLLILAFLFIVAAAFFLFETRRWRASTRIGAGAALYLAGLLVLNILSLHGLDRLLGRSFAGIPLRWMFDFAGLGAAIAAAYAFRRATRIR